MSVSIDTETAGTTLAKIHALYYGFSIFVILGLIGELINGQLGISFLLWSAFVALCLMNFRQVLHNLQYSLWSFSLGFAIFNVVGAINAESSFVLNCYIISLILLAIASAIISSPLFYPRITWWEYDFRFRAELKIEVHHNHKSIPGRLTDLRRQAGCIVLFEPIEPGTELSFSHQIKQDTKETHTIKIISRRASPLGRGYIYGVQFLYPQKEDQDYFIDLANRWKFIKKAKRLAKFQTKNNVVL